MEKAGPNPTDRGKLGTKRWVVTDARRLPIEVMPVTRPEALLDKALDLCLDKGYDYDVPRQVDYAYNLIACIRRRGEKIRSYQMISMTRLVAGWSSSCISGSIAFNVC